MWATKMRGHEVGGVQLAGLRLADGSSALGKLAPVLTLAIGEVWLIKPMQTKTEKANVVQPRRVRFGVGVHHLDPAVWVHRAILMAALARQPITGQLVRTLTRDRQGFQETPLQSTAVNHVFKKRLSEAGVLEGQTPHGIRRGAIQAAVAAGRSPQEVMEQAHMVTPGVFQRYMDPVRHLRDR